LVSEIPIDVRRVINFLSIERQRILNVFLSAQILRCPKYNGLSIFGNDVFWKFAFLKRNRLFYEKAVILKAVQFLRLY
jgi:hypothetical protein